MYAHASAAWVLSCYKNFSKNKRKRRERERESILPVLTETILLLLKIKEVINYVCCVSMQNIGTN